jgi:hypothetical protein
VTATSIEKVNGHEPRFDPVALAEAEAIRTRAAAEAEAARIKAEGEAEAEKIRAAEEAAALRLENEKQALANERAALRFQREQAEQHAKIAEAERKREETERAREEARRQADEQAASEKNEAEKLAKAEGDWKFFAVAFAAVCAVVALPVQMAAFWNEKAPWMISAPFMLEGAAWVVLRGAAAAVAAHRPHWHFRLIAWLLAFVSAAVNLGHGLAQFDTATAIGTAFASIAGPAIWDLHEHGRIRKRDGVLTRRERRAQRKQERAEAARKAAEAAQRAAEKEAADKAAAEAAKQLAETRADEFPEVWKHALRLAAALGETTVTEAVWRRAHLDIEGTDPGESAETIRARNVAAKRVESARTGTPVNTLSKTTNAQRASQVPGPKKPRVYNPPARRGRRTKGDVKFAPAARRQASIAAKQITTPKDTP